MRAADFDSWTITAPDGCIVWMAGRTADGYGRCRIGGRDRYAHRFAYERAHGPIPDGLEIDHLCRNRACCNPAHLEAVTHLENVRRGAAPEQNRIRGAAVTHCPQGHAYDEENTYVRKSGTRACRECTRIRNRAYWRNVRKFRGRRARVAS